MASPTRPYAVTPHDLLHFLRWWAGAHKTSAITQQALTESTFLDYIRFQVGQDPPPAAASINRRVGTAERAMRRVPRRRASVGTRLPALVLAPVAARLWQTAPGADSTTGEDAEAHGGAVVARCGGSLLVQLPHLARLGHRGPDVTARLAVLRGPGPQPRGRPYPDSQIQVLGKGKKIRVLPLTRESLDLTITTCAWNGRPTVVSPYSFLSKGQRAATA